MRTEFYTLNNLEDVWVKSWEQRDGLAIFSAAEYDLKQSFDPNNYFSPQVLMYLSEDRKVFVVNTEHPWLAEGSKFINFNKPERYTSFDIGGHNVCVVSEGLASEIVGYIAPEVPIKEEPTLNDEGSWYVPTVVMPKPEEAEEE